jgi:hypothetical protein
MVFGIAHDFHSSTAGDYFIALWNGLGGVVRAFRVYVRADFTNDRSDIRLGENYHGVYIGQRSQNFSTFLCRQQRTTFTFKGAHGGVRVDGHDQSPAQPFGGVQVTHVSHVQQVEAAIGQGDGVTCPAPFRYLLL